MPIKVIPNRGSLGVSKRLLIFTRLALATVVPRFACAAPQGQPTLQITSPAPGTVVNPGQTLAMSVTSSSPSSFPGVLLGGDLTGFLGTISALPGELSITIPSSDLTLGPHRLSAQGTPTSGGPPIFAQVNIADISVLLDVVETGVMREH
jgi:hypothetical protein